jgi:hypothetical protein
MSIMPVMQWGMYAIDIHFSGCDIDAMADEANSERIITPMPPSLVKVIDDYRFAHRIASRAEAIRQLIARGLEASADSEKSEK